MDTMVIKRNCRKMMIIDNIQVHSAFRQPSKSAKGQKESLFCCPRGKMADIRAKGKWSAGSSSKVNFRDLMPNSTFD